MRHLLVVIFSLWCSRFEIRDVFAIDYADTEPAPWTIVYTIHPLYNAQSYLEVWKNNGFDNNVADMEPNNIRREDQSLVFDRTVPNNKTSDWPGTQNFTHNRDHINKFSNEDKQHQIWRTIPTM